MNWTRIVIAALAGAIATNLANFVMHGLMLANTYAKHAVFSQEPANPL